MDMYYADVWLAGCGQLETIKTVVVDDILDHPDLVQITVWARKPGA